MIDQRSGLVVGGILLVLLSGCVQPEAPAGGEDESAFRDWTSELDETVSAPHAICTETWCALRSSHPGNRVTFSNPESALIGVDLEVTFPHPDHPPQPPSASFQSLVVTVSCDDETAGDCGSFGEPRIFEGASPVPIVLDHLMLAPGSKLILEFRFPDPVIVPGITFEFDAYGIARLHGSLLYHGPLPAA